MLQIILLFAAGILGVSKYFSLKEKGYPQIYSMLSLLGGIILLIYAFIRLMQYI